MKLKASVGQLAMLARIRLERRREPTPKDLAEDEALQAQGCLVWRLNGIALIIDLSRADER